MLTLGRAKTLAGKAGEPIPTPFTQLREEGVHIRRGQFTLISAAPGVGKSLYSLKVALASGVRTFYASADTDGATTWLRAASMLTGDTTYEIEQKVKAGNTRQIDAEIGKVRHMRFSFDSPIDLDKLEEDISVYGHVYGAWPDLVVIDNIRNMEMGESGDGSSSDAAACDYLHDFAHTTGCAVVGLHHVVGMYDNGTTPVPQSGLINKVSKVPEMILTLYRSEDVGTTGRGALFVCPVKNRTGKADPSGNWSIPLRYEPARMLLEDWTPNG